MGLFCAGIGWIYVALHIYGYMHPVLAALATALFAAVNATLPALAGYAQAKLKATPNLRILLIMPAIWTLAEWLRGLLFTGFPWLSVGYSQVPNSPLAGYAPLIGVFGVSLIVALSAGLLLVLWSTRWSKPGKVALGGLLALWVAGAVLGGINWTHPQGEPLKVSLLQGNIAQDTKFAEDELVATLETYRRLAQSSDARLIVMPETALPLLRHNVPEYYQAILADHVRKNGGDILVGAFEKENGNYYNSVYSLGSAESQHYRKDHLVPFGEFIPLRSVLGWLINEVLNIPMGDLTSGGTVQVPLNVAGQKVAVNICYEDAFGEEIIRALPQATLLVNVTNDAWYGESHAAMQHNQLSQMRALETGRMVLRATNTGVTSVIGVDGRIQAMLPQFEAGVLTATVQGYVGGTPYIWVGNWGMLGVIVVMLGVAWGLQRRMSPRPLAGEG
jgi:apolipoprotein N-acyltransferase